MREPHIHVPRGARVTENQPWYSRVFFGFLGILLALIALGAFSNGDIWLGAIAAFFALGAFVKAGSSIQDR